MDLVKILAQVKALCEYYLSWSWHVPHPFKYIYNIIWHFGSEIPCQQWHQLTLPRFNIYNTGWGVIENLDTPYTPSCFWLYGILLIPCVCNQSRLRKVLELGFRACTNNGNWRLGSRPKKQYYGK